MSIPLPTHFANRDCCFGPAQHAQQPIAASQFRRPPHAVRRRDRRRVDGDARAAEGARSSSPSFRRLDAMTQPAGMALDECER
jgi:hypothetical protein